MSSRKDDLPSADVGRQAASLILDIDKDGVNDFVIAGWSEKTSMVWFRCTTEGWERYLVDNRKSHIEGRLHLWRAPSWAEIEAEEKKLESTQSP